jgi:DNA-binding CsgD family transcriptional regulator
MEDALALIGRFVERADEVGAPVRGRQIGVQMLLAPALYLGRPQLYLSAFDEYVGRVPAVLRATAFVWLTTARAICLALLGHVDEARRLAGPLLDDVEGGGSDEEWGTTLLAMLLQVALVLDRRTAAEVLAAQLACVAHVALDNHSFSCIGRHLGDAAALRGDRTSARAYYKQALDAAGRIRFRPELALTHLRLAELLYEDEAERSEALEHLDVAIPELQDMHMQPSLERGLALRDKLTPAQAMEPARQSASDTLTAREREIASLVADGLSNRDIAEKLVISEGTVEVHVKHVLGKLGFSSRAQVAGWFARQGPG